MGDWRRIGCPVDFSEASRVALREAAELARRFGAELVLLHVVEPAGPAGSELAFAPPRARRGEAGTSPIAEWEAEAVKVVGPRVESLELAGSPAEEIVRFAAEGRCDALVLGTHGRTGFRRLVLGSVAAHVVRDAPCPVVVVPHRTA